jgi:hypothetical protein
VIKIRQNCPIVPRTGNPFGHGSSIPLLSHQWNCHLWPIQHLTKDYLYFTTSSLSWPSIYIPFLRFPYNHPSLSSQWSAVLVEINALLILFHVKIACILGLATISMTSSALKKPPFAFSIICILISPAMSSSSRIVPRVLFCHRHLVLGSTASVTRLVVESDCKESHPPWVAFWQRSNTLQENNDRKDKGSTRSPVYSTGDSTCHPNNDRVSTYILPLWTRVGA